MVPWFVRRHMLARYLPSTFWCWVHSTMACWEAHAGQVPVFHFVVSGQLCLQLLAPMSWPLMGGVVTEDCILWCGAIVAVTCLWTLSWMLGELVAVPATTPPCPVSSASHHSTLSWFQCHPPLHPVLVPVPPTTPPCPGSSTTHHSTLSW